MTTEDDFQAALDTNHKDWQTRLVFADWLDDRGDIRAAGYRKMGERHLVPSCSKKDDKPLWSWTSTETGRSYGYTLRACWYRRIPSRLLTDLHEDLPRMFHGVMTVQVTTRRELEDNTALAYAKLTPAQQAQC